MLKWLYKDIWENILFLSLTQYIQFSSLFKEAYFCNKEKHDRKPQAIKCKTVKPGPKVYTYNTAAAPKTQGSFWKTGQKVIRARGSLRWNCVSWEG